MGLNTGARAYLTHPINPDEMLATISSLMRSDSKLEDVEKQREVAEAQSENLRAEKIMLERFMRSFSHDLRSPLAAAVMVAGLMQKNPARRTEEMITLLEENLRRIDKMVANILDISHVSMGGGIRLIGEQMPLAPAGGSRGQPAPAGGEPAHPRRRGRGPAGVLGQAGLPAHLRQPGAQCRQARRGGHHHRGVAARENDRVLLCVSNRGAFPEEVLANLATPYFISTRSDTKSWDLGLPIVKALCESGGSVAFANQEGRAEVHLSLPAALVATP